MVDYQQTDYDFARVSTGYLRNWSEEWGAPYGPAETASIDPRGAAVWDTVSLTLDYEQTPLVQSRLLGPGSGVEEALYHIAKAIDQTVPDVHAWSHEYKIGVQSRFHIVRIASLTLTPYRFPPGAWALHPYIPDDPNATTLVYEVALGSQPHRFEVPYSGNLDAALTALAEKINQHPLLQAGRVPDGFLVSCAPHVDMTSGGYSYG